MNIRINDNDIELRLTTKRCINLEKELGENPLKLFMRMADGELPKMSDIVLLLHTLTGSTNFDSSCKLLDEYLCEGHTAFELLPMFIETFQEAGFIPKTEEEGKN